MEPQSEQHFSQTTNPYLRNPLPEGYKILISRECDNFTVDSHEVLNIIVSAVSSNDVYSKIIASLTPILKENTVKFVNKIMMYKKKPCREGKNCKRGMLCIFSHEFMKRHAPPSSNNIDDNEVIFNRVPSNLCDVEVIKQYAGQYGIVTDVKSLKEDKYLIKFSTHSEARSLMNSKEPVLGDYNIKKFINRARTEDIDDLFDQHDDVIRKLNETNADKALLKRLSWIIGKVRGLVGGEDKVKRFKKDSLFCNSKFVME